MKNPEIATPQEFFLEKSRFRKHPNFSKIKNDYIDLKIMEQESGKPTATKRQCLQAYQVWV